MDIFDPVMLSRIQFGFVISFHIIFPAFTIGLAAWLATLEGLRYFTGKPIYGRLFDFWLRVFAVSFALGVVTGIVMAFQFGTNWGVLAEKTGSIQGPLLGYESFTAFMLEASFFAVMLLGRQRIWPGFYLFACCMVTAGTIEARWQTQQPASEVLFAWPDEKNERNQFALEIPKLGSYIASGNWTSSETWLVIVGASLFAAFPAVYAVFMGAFYLTVFPLWTINMPAARSVGCTPFLFLPVLA